MSANASFKVNLQEEIHVHQETLKEIVAELAAYLPGRFLRKIYQLSDVSLAIDFGLRSDGLLFISVEPASPRLYLIKRSARELEEASVPPSGFAQLLRARLSDRAICRSLAPPCFRRRISRTRRIDTLSAGIGPPARHCRDEQKAEHCPAVERLPPLRGGRPQIGVAEIKSESVADFIPESVADFVRNTHAIPTIV